MALGIFTALEKVLGRRAELHEYAEKVDPVLADLTRRIGELEEKTAPAPAEPAAAPVETTPAAPAPATA